jgi:hypothetical protein
MTLSNNSKQKQGDDVQTMGNIRITLVGLYYIVVALLLVYVLYRIWPFSGSDVEEQILETVSFFKGLIGISISREVRLILIVLAAGGLGSFIHGGTSFATFAGNRRLKLSWTWWYILRPFIGSVLALIFYFVIRGGLLSVSAGTEAISHFGIAAMAGIVGMFSKEAIDKLHELFVTLFRHTDQREDKLKPESAEPSGKKEEEGSESRG